MHICQASVIDIDNIYFLCADILKTWNHCVRKVRGYHERDDKNMTSRKASLHRAKISICLG